MNESQYGSARALIETGGGKTMRIRNLAAVALMGLGLAATSGTAFAEDHWRDRDRRDYRDDRGRDDRGRNRDWERRERERREREQWRDRSYRRGYSSGYYAPNYYEPGYYAEPVYPQPVYPRSGVSGYIYFGRP